MGVVTALVISVGAVLVVMVGVAVVGVGGGIGGGGSGGGVNGVGLFRCCCCCCVLRWRWWGSCCSSCWSYRWWCVWRSVIGWLGCYCCCSCCFLLLFVPFRFRRVSVRRQGASSDEARGGERSAIPPLPAGEPGTKRLSDGNPPPRGDTTARHKSDTRSAPHDTMRYSTPLLRWPLLDRPETGGGRGFPTYF